MMTFYASFIAVSGFVLVHLLAVKLQFLDGTPRSIWLSIAGGVSVAYVFIHVLPELSAGQESVAQAWEGAPAFLEHHVYLIALLGLAVFYGLDRLALASRQRQRDAGTGDQTSSGVFWIHIGSFAIYNLLIGYLLLHREQPGWFSLAIFFVAMALHFIVTDHSLREHHKGAYLGIGRYILAAAVALGWMIGLMAEVSEAFIAALFAFLAGGVMLNVLKEELPEERQSRYWAFTVGVAAYAALLLAL